METIRRLTITRKTTVVCSIHQPRSDIFNLFDNVLVLSRGGFPVYCGPTADVVSYFSKLGHACPLDQNPADYIVDISSVDPRDGAARAASTRRVRRLEREFRRACDSRADLEAGAAAAGVISAAPLPSAQPELPGKPEQPQRRVQMETYKAPWLLQVTTLVGRFMRNSYRDTSAAAGGLLQAAVLGIVIMAIFWQLGNDPASVRSRFGVVYSESQELPRLFSPSYLLSFLCSFPPKSAPLTPRLSLPSFRPSPSFHHCGAIHFHDHLRGAIVPRDEGV